ncbi:hypothetical protein Tco_0011134 [Tanacetum coccineum]
MSNSTPDISPDVAEHKDMVKALLLDKKNQSQAPATVKAVEESCVTCGGAHSYQNCPATNGNVYRDNIQEILVEPETEVTKDTVPPTNNGSTKDVQPPVVQVQPQVPNFEPVVVPFSALKPNPKLSIPYPSRLNDQKIREKANNQIEKFYPNHSKISFRRLAAAECLIAHCQSLL